MDDSDESAITMTQNINKTREALDRQNRAVLDQNRRSARAFRSLILSARSSRSTAPLSNRSQMRRQSSSGVSLRTLRRSSGISATPWRNFLTVRSGWLRIRMRPKPLWQTQSVASTCWRNTKAISHVSADKTEFDTNAAQARDLLKILDQSKAAPEIAPILDKLKAGKQITLADLQEIGAKVAEPEVIAKVADALRDVNAVAVAADNAARKRTLVNRRPGVECCGKRVARSWKLWPSASAFAGTGRWWSPTRVRGRRPDASTIGRG
ncbi:hypothetical protein GS941_22035 [Rhodococcus hoagii]|nr:hypothetical protein [Prescottella equi]